MHTQVAEENGGAGPRLNEGKHGWLFRVTGNFERGPTEPKQSHLHFARDFQF